MIEPALAFIMVRVTAFTVLKQDLRLILITSSQFSSDILISKLSRVIPALFTRMSIPPKNVTTSPINLSAAAKSEASERKPLAFIPKASNSFSSASPFSTLDK